MIETAKPLTFNVPLLNGMSHNNETRKILKPYAKARRQSIFLRTSILAFAITRGYKPVEILDCNRPKYVASKDWQRIKVMQEKAQSKIYYADCNFAVAFFWLRSLKEFQHYKKKSHLMREIIITQHQRHQL